MTEQEVETLVARLRLIWGPEIVIDNVDTSAKDSLWISGNGEGGITFSFCKEDVGERIILKRFAEKPEWEEDGRLDWNGPSRDLRVKSLYSCDDEGYHETFAEFATKWLPFFRRGCWLSGADVEAIQHEKLEWHLWLQEQEVRCE